MMSPSFRRLNPYPPDYRAAFAFSLILYPPLSQRSLRFAFPAGTSLDGESDGLTTFHWKDKRSG